MTRKTIAKQILISILLVGSIGIAMYFYDNMFNSSDHVIHVTNIIGTIFFSGIFIIGIIRMFPEIKND